jgi:rhodanese-related sulfurtransferase
MSTKKENETMTQQLEKNSEFIIDHFSIDETEATKIIKTIDMMMSTMSMSEIIEHFLDDKILNGKQLQFTMFIIGYMGSRHITLNEIASKIGEERFLYFMNENDDRKNPMYG